MIPPERVDAVRAAAARAAPAWRELKANVDASLERTRLDDTSVMNIAVVYLGTHERRYCDRLALEARRILATANPRRDSYYDYAGVMGAAAAVLSHCGPLLEEPLHADIASYLDRWTDELWFHNRGSGWGLDDPGNNYYVSFLLGTAWAALALRNVDHPHAEKYLAIVTRGVTRELAYLADRCPGGGWIEGTNYGEGSKARLADLLSLLAAAGVSDRRDASKYFAAALRYAHYQLQPGNVYLYPAGDMARVSDMTVSSYDRQYVQQMVYWLPDSDARALGQWYLRHVARDYHTSFRYPQALWRDVVYGLDLPEAPQRMLPLSYRARGDEFVSMRSGWDRHATALMVSGASRIDQSHAHLDTGGFTLWREGWQVVDAVTYSHSGLLQEPGAHNLIHVSGARKAYVTPTGLLRFGDDARASYLQIDGTGLYTAGDPARPGNALLREFTREIVYLKPDTVVVYDRIQPELPGTAFDLRVHFPGRPTASGDTVRSNHGGGGVTVKFLIANTLEILSDGDLAPDGSKTWRAQATTGTGRFLTVARVASGSAPSLEAAMLTTTGDLEGVAMEDSVVLFSRLPFGRAPGARTRYSVPARPGRLHTLVNMSGSVGVAIHREATSSVVTITEGSDRTADAEGVIRFNE
jgi:hypothetical protein